MKIIAPNHEIIKKRRDRYSNLTIIPSKTKWNQNKKLRKTTQIRTAILTIYKRNNNLEWEETRKTELDEFENKVTSFQSSNHTNCRHYLTQSQRRNIVQVANELVYCSRAYSI